MINKMYYFSELSRQLKEAGIPASKQTLNLWQKQGKLTLRRFPHNQWRFATEEDLKEIIRAFSPGGKGKWHYVKNK